MERKGKNIHLYLKFFSKDYSLIFIMLLFTLKIKLNKVKLMLFLKEEQGIFLYFRRLSV